MNIHQAGFFLPFPVLYPQTNGAHLDIDAGEELLAPHVPDSLVGERLLLRPSAILQLGRGQHAASHLRAEPQIRSFKNAYKNHRENLVENA